MFNDLMENIEWFFNLHDKNKDGYLTKDEVLTLSESLLVSGSQLVLVLSPLIGHGSLSSATKSETHTSAPLAGSCLMPLSTATPYSRDLRGRIPTRKRLRSNRTSHTSTLPRMTSSPV